MQFGACPRERGLQCYQTGSHAVVLYNTLLAASIEKAVCITTDELYQKVRLTPRVPRVVLKSTSQSGLQCPQNQGARSTWEPSSDSKSYEEICNSTVDHRIAGIPLSAVEPQNTIRENKVKRLIEKFENHKNKISLIQDFETDGEDQHVQQRIARPDGRHDQHRDLRTMRKFFQTSMSSLQCLLGNGIIYHSCGRNMKSTRSPTEFDQNNRDVTSIPGYVIKKNRSRGAKHGASERQKMYFHAKQMLKKFRQEKHALKMARQ